MRLNNKSYYLQQDCIINFIKYLQEDKVMKKPKNKQSTPTKLPKGGLITKRSRCCNAPVIIAGRGLLTEVCSKCKSPHYEQKMK